MSSGERSLNDGSSSSVTQRTCKCRRLEGKVAIIIGSTLGIGLAIAERLGHEGADVVVCSRKQNHVDSAVESLKKQGISVLGTTCHVSHKQDRQRLIKQTVDKFGGIDILVLNAGVNPHHGLALEATEEVVDKIFDVNVKSCFYACKEIVPFMKERGGGSIVFMNSLSAYAQHWTLSMYSVSKAAILGLTKALVHQCASMNIRVNAIAPGLITTKFSEKLRKEFAEGRHKDFHVPMKRPGAPEECAGAVAFLVSDDASYITGETIAISGGSQSHL